MTTNQATGKIKASRVNNLAADTYVGPAGQLWYDVDTGILRLGDNVTPGGTIVGGGGGSPGGANGSIQFNNNGSFAGNTSLTYNIVSNTLSLNGTFSTTGNVTGDYFIGNGSQLTGLAATYGNSNVADYLPTYTGDITANNISTIGNITGNYIFGNGSQLTGLPATYGNSNVADYLPTYTGNITANIISAAGNITGSNLLTNGNLSVAGNAVIVGNLNVQGNVTFIDGNVITTNDLYIQLANNQSTYANINNAGLAVGPANAALTYWQYQTSSNAWSTNVSISASGNITGNYFIGDGSQLTGISTGNITFSNTTISTNIANANIILSPTGTGVVSIANTVGGATGIQMGTPSLGNLTGAVTLTTATSITNGLAQLNSVLGKLIPTQPPAFPGGTPLSISTGTTTAKMCTGFTQTDNTPAGNKSVAAGTTINAIRGSTYTTNTISNTGPGDSGTLTVLVNGADYGNVTFNTNATPTGNGTHGNLIITNNYDYHNANSSIAAGFWYVFTAYATGAVTQGWNEVYLTDTAAGNTNTPYWYYDSSTASAPSFSSVTISACASPSLTYSSTIAHYNSGTYFNLGFNVNRLSANMYPNNTLLTSGVSAGGAFQAPTTVAYTSAKDSITTANLTVPLTQNLYVSSGNATANTTAYITSGFGASASGPSVTVTNSYNSASTSFNPGNTVLYKTGTSTAIEETNIIVNGSTGSPIGNIITTASAYRIVNPSGNTVTNTPTFYSNGNAVAFNSQTGPLYTTDSVVIGSGTQGVLRFSQVNYSTGYLPVGPDLTTQEASQYFTFRFNVRSLSKFNIQYVGTVAGMWVACPGTALDTSVNGIGPTSSINGWLSMTQAAGSTGVPGANTGNGGNGTDGCALAGAVLPNVAQTNPSTAFGYTCSFGQLDIGTQTTVYVRILLTSGQSVTALSIQPASN